MKRLVSTIVMTNTTDGHNKVWTADLYDNGDVVTKWGPINGWEKSKTFKKRKQAEPFLIEKLREKEDKGYVVVRTQIY